MVTHKIVRYYLARASLAAVSGSDETVAAEWVEVGDVLGRLQFDEEKKVFIFLNYCDSALSRNDVFTSVHYASICAEDEL